MNKCEWALQFYTIMNNTAWTVTLILFSFLLAPIYSMWMFKSKRNFQTVFQNLVNKIHHIQWGIFNQGCQSWPHVFIHFLKVLKPVGVSPLHVLLLVVFHKDWKMHLNCIVDFHKQICVSDWSIALETSTGHLKTSFANYFILWVFHKLSLVLHFFKVPINPLFHKLAVNYESSVLCIKHLLIIQHSNPNSHFFLLSMSLSHLTVISDKWAVTQSDCSGNSRPHWVWDLNILHPLPNNILPTLVLKCRLKSGPPTSH